MLSTGIYIMFCIFFFSSRRRHTRLQGDWSSDVCSSDLFQVSKAWAAWGSLGVVLGAAYLLWLYQRVMFGPVTQFANEDLPDLNLREYATLVPLVILAFWIGIYPKPFFALIEKPVENIVRQVNPDFYKAEQAKLPPAELHAAPAETK